MKLLIITSNIPHATHAVKGVTAVNVVSRALLEAWREQGHNLILQVILDTPSRNLGAVDQQILEDMAAAGFTILPILCRADYQAPPAAPFSRLWQKMRRAMRIPLVDFYPSVRLRETMQQQIKAHHPDAVLTLWSPEGVGALYQVRDAPRIIYHGDIDFLPHEARLKHPALFGGSRANWLTTLRTRRYVNQMKAAHWELMRGMEVIANVTAANAEFYRQRQHPASIYVPNVWPDPGLDKVQTILNAAIQRRQAQQPIKMIGHVGYLDRTGSQFGLHFLDEVMPHLDRLLLGIPYEMHLIGEGTLNPQFQHLKAGPRVIVRGYVEDLDRELESSDVFLMLNNAGPLIAAFTRHMVAWSSGMCLVAHQGSLQAIPEIQHGENTLVGADPVEIAAMIAQAGRDIDLNVRLRRGGRALYERCFTPHRVAARLLETRPQSVL
jgi:glycosyltransferase involved in cell wall biosynthesis